MSTQPNDIQSPDEMLSIPDQANPLEVLARVATAHGVELTAGDLRRNYVDVPDDLNSQWLMAVAREAGLDAKSVHPKWQQLPRLTNILPAIIRLNDGGAAVLRSVISSPQVGQAALIDNVEEGGETEIALDETQFNELWTGEVILIKRRHNATDEAQPFGLAWLLGQVLRERRIFREVAIASVIITILGVAPPIIAMTVIDKVLVNHSVSTLWVLTGAVAFVMAAEMALGYFRRKFMEVAATRIDARLNLYMMKKILSLPMEYFETSPTGLTMSKLSKIWQIRSFMTGTLLNTFIDMVMLVILVPVLLMLEWHLALFVLALVGFIFVIIASFLPAMSRAHQKIVAAEQMKGTYLTETVYGMRTIKSLALEAGRRKTWDSHVARSAEARYEMGVITNFPQTLTLPFERAIYAGSIMLGAAISLANPEVVLPGVLMAFAMLAMRAAAPLVNMARLLNDLGEVRGAIGEAASIFNHPAEQSRAGTGLRLPVYGNISFQGVNFRYAPGSPLALNDVSIDIRAGTIFGLMGRSGSGKTTITRLLQGLNPKYEGIIKIDGMDLREIDLRHLRTSIGVVAQENFLFSGTIRENIGIARPNTPFPEIVRAAQLAGAEEFIERLPRGYDTFIAEGGANLSGGQRQRLAIARALVLDPAVLILDEATSALDAESEAIINANLLRIAQSRTIICVSHRLAMLVPADAILVMEKGKVYDIGTHQELLHRCDIYKHMWYTQNRHTQPETPHALRTIAHSSVA
jgi:ATP-binding cassette subfamily B protein